MKAAVFPAVNTPLPIEDVNIDGPMAREVVVRTAASGVCHSDLHFIEGLYPMVTPSILGHEAAGVVEEVGELVTYLQPGDHVISCLSVFCGHCRQCLSGHPSRCSQRPRRAEGEPPRLSLQDGTPINQGFNLSSYGERMLVHENALVKIDDDMPLDRAALIGCGVITGVGAVFNTARIEPGCSVAVFGLGGVGLAVVQGARIAGARQIIAVDVVEPKLTRALEVGATHVVDASSRDPVEAIRDLSGGGVDYSFEAIGLKIAAEQAWNCLIPGGTATVVGMIPVGEKVEIEGRMFLSERKIQGSGMGSNRFRTDMPRLIDLYRQGRLLLDEMITRRGRLEDVNEAFRAMKAGEVTRSVLMYD